MGLIAIWSQVAEEHYRDIRNGVEAQSDGMLQSPKVLQPDAVGQQIAACISSKSASRRLIIGYVMALAIKQLCSHY